MFDLKTRVLVVDDMMTMRKLVIKSCKEMGFTDFTEAADGAKAWEALANASPPIGLIVSDWNMPNCSGLDFLKRVRAESRFKKLPFLLVTAEAEKQQVIEALAAGVTEYVIKPFTRESLEERVKAAYKKISGT